MQSTSDAPSLQPYLTSRLSIMMFLQFFIWGAWYVTVGNYMGEIGMGASIYWAYTVGPIAAIISPFFLGMVADRYFASEKVLGTVQILGGIALLLSPMMAEWSVAGWAEQADAMKAAGQDPQAYLKTAFIVPAHLPFIGMLMIHMLFYMPTLGLTNSLAFHNITNQEKQFPIIRVFGTIGWIVAGTIVSKLLGADKTAIPLYVAGGASVLMGFYSFSLPHTPPPAAGAEKPSIREIMGLDALAKLSSPSFWTFIIASVLICIPLSAYYAYAPVYVEAVGIENPGFKMSFGQYTEVAFMLVMPIFFVRLGVKWMLFVGMLAWVARYALFAWGAESGVPIGLDDQASMSATSGVFWMIMGGILLHGICYDFFFVTGQIYVDKKSTPAIRGQAQGALVLLTLGLGMLIGAQVSGNLFNAFELAIDPEAPAPDPQEHAANWRLFWLIPTIGAGVIMLAFAFLFKDSVDKKDATGGEVASAAATEEQP